MGGWLGGLMVVLELMKKKGVMEELLEFIKEEEGKW